MSYREDPVHRTVEWLRSSQAEANGFADAYAEAWRSWSGVKPTAVRAEVELVNYKPFERARVVAQATLDVGPAGSPPLAVKLFLHAFADEAAARAEIARAGERRDQPCYGPPASYLAAQRLVIWTLPNAPELPELAALLDPVRFKSLISGLPGIAADGPACRRPALVRYVPLKRALLTWQAQPDTPRLYIKLYNEREAAAAALNHQEISAWTGRGERGFVVPRPLRYSVGLHTLVMTEVPGRPFTEFMARSDPSPFAEVGRALAGLHKTPAGPATLWSLAAELADLGRHMAGAKLALPAIAGQVDAVLTRLSERAADLPAGPVAPIHGNLFGDQILYDEGSPDRRVGLVDWDRWSLGDPRFDLGRLIAHVLYVTMVAGQPRSHAEAGIAQLVGSYEEAAGRTIGADAGLAWHVAAAVLLRAKISSLRKLADGWPGHLEWAVGEAERVLRDGCPLDRRQPGRAVA